MNDKLDDIIKLIDKALLSADKINIAIDGKAASGKTTLAKQLSEIYDCNVIHMDDFFLPTELRTEERYARPGGNVHYERFQQEVIAGLKKQEAFSYKIFDCSLMSYSKEVTVVPKKINIIEGCYCLHPYFDDIYNIKIFSSISPEEQRKRILIRNGEAMYKRFAELWIPMENRYFDYYNIMDKCQLALH